MVAGDVGLVGCVEGEACPAALEGEVSVAGCGGVTLGRLVSGVRSGATCSAGRLTMKFQADELSANNKTVGLSPLEANPLMNR